MKAALCLLTLCLAGYVSSSQFAWQTGKQYKYSVQARLFSGVAIATQYAGLQVRYDIVVTVTGANTLHLNPQNFRAVELDANIKAGWRDGELQNETPVQIKKELLEYLESNIELQMENGVVKSINVEEHLPTWAVNIKKAQVSHLVLDTTGTNAVLNGNLNRQTNSVRPDEANQESGFFYETMEETVHGECETYYTVSQNGAFDWPNQFQAQAQPGQNKNRNGQNQSGESQENNNNSNGYNSNENNQNKNSQENSSQQKDDDDSSEEYRHHTAKYAAYKRLAQRQDSQSAEDSHENYQGELPWPKAFADFCNDQDQVYEIIKTVNFTACKNKPVLAYSTNAGLYGRAGDNTLGAALSRVLVSRYLACGKDRKQFTILKIEQEEQVNYGLRLDQNTVAGSIQNITLRSVSNAQRVEPLRKSKTINDLTYTFDPKEQRLQREGKLQHAYFDIMEENESSEEQRYSTSTTTERYNRQDRHLERNNKNKSRKPRSVDSQEDSDEDNSSSQESNEKAYKTDAEGRQFLRQPSLEYPPVNPLLVSPLQSSGMQKRVEALMKEIVQDILTDNQPMAETETLSKISTVARIIRYQNAQDILAQYHKFASKSQTEEDQTARSVYLDAVAIAGTNPAIVTLFQLIKSEEVAGEQANQLVMTLPMYIRTPTKGLLHEFYNFVESSVVEKSLQLKSTAVLAFSNTLYQAFVNLRIKNSRYPVALYGEFGNERDLQQLYVPYFQKNVQQWSQKEQSEENNKHWTILYLAAFGNLGVKDVVPEVQRILDDSTDAYIKTKAVLALHRVIVSRQTQNIPVHQVHGVDRNGQDGLTDEVVEKQVMPVLMSVAFDKGEHPEVRMAAISLLLHTTNADVTIWQQLAYATWFESSNEVHSFIYSSLKSLAYLDENVPSIHWHMQRKARAVLALAKPITPGYAKSRNSFAAGVAEHLQSNYVHQFSYFGSKDSNVPNYMFYKNLVQYGNKAIGVSPLQFSLHGHTIQKLASFVLAQYRKNNQNDQSSHKELDQIYQFLGISRREQNEDVEGSLQFKIRDEMERIFSVNEDLIQELTKRAQEQGLPKLLSGIPINYQKTVHASETTFEMPSIIGVPITFSSRTPVHVSLRGNVRLVQEGNNFADVQVQAEFHPVLAAKTHDRLSFKVPFTGKKYQAGVQRHFVVEVPFRALARRAPRGQYVVAFTPSLLNKGAPAGPIPVFTFHQKPYTAIITDSLWPTTHKEGGQMNIVHVTEQPFQRQYQFGQQLVGLSFKSEEVSEYRSQNERNSGWVRFWQRFHSTSCFFQLGWLGGERVRYAERKLVLDIANSETKTIAFVVAGKRQQSASAKDLWQDSSSQSSQSTEESASSESKQDSSSQQQNSIEDQDNQSAPPSRQRRHHGSASDSGASQSAEDYSQGGYIFAAAVIGKRIPIRPVEDGKAQIQKILQKGTPSTIQYLVQLSKSSGRVYIRAATGDAANEAAKALPQTSQSLQALREAIVESPNTKTQPDGCFELEGEYDAPKWANRGELLVLRKQLLAQELSVNVKTEIQFGQSCAKMPHEIKIQGKLFRGPKQTEWAQSKSRKAQKCTEDEKKGFHTSPVCMHVAEQQAAALNKGDFKIQFTQMPKVFLNRTDDVEDFAKALLYPYVSTDRFHDGAGDQKLRVEFFLTPNKEFLDVHITKPHSKLSFRSIRTNRAIRAVLPLTATQSLPHNMRDRALRADSDPSCSVQGNFVSTFDNVTYRFSEKSGENCYHLLAQDASLRQPVAVLVKDISTNQKKVVIYLNAKTKIELTPQQGKNQQQRGRQILGNDQANLYVEINEQRVESLPRVVRSKSTGKYIARIEKMYDGGVQVFTNTFDVAANGEYVVVFASNSLRNRTAGVCGNFNGEKGGDMRSPKNCPLSSGSALVASYAVKPQVVEASDKGQCQVDAQLRKQVQREEAQCLQDPAYLPNNPRMFPQSSQNNNQFYQNQNGKNQLQLTSQCVDEVTRIVRTTVYQVIRKLLTPFIWMTNAQKDAYAKKISDDIANKIEEFMKQGTAQKIAQKIVDYICYLLEHLPFGQSMAKVVCKLGKPLLVKAVLVVLNPICKSTQCCQPSQNVPSQSEIDQALAFAFPDEAAEDDDSPIPYLTSAEARLKSCDEKLFLLMKRSSGHLVHFLLQGNEHMSERQRSMYAKKVEKEVGKAVKDALKHNRNVSAQIMDAIERTLPSQAPFDGQVLQVSIQYILRQLCQSQSHHCCFPNTA